MWNKVLAFLGTISYNESYLIKEREMKAENLIAKAEAMGLIQFVANVPCDPYYATVNGNHEFMYMGGYNKTIDADIDMWVGAHLSIVDMIDESVVLA